MCYMALSGAILGVILLSVAGQVAGSQGEGTWLPPKKTSCDLHPAIEARIAEDMKFFDEQGGISEEAATSVCQYCDIENWKEGGEEENCNKPQRYLIQNGTVYVTNLLPTDKTGSFEFLGLLVELYETSQVYSLPDVELTWWHGDNAPSYTVVKDGKSAWPYGSGTPAVVSWSKWKENAVLVVPYSGAFRCPDDSFDALEAQITGIAGIPWEERKQIAFGRWNAFCTHYISWQKTEDGQVMKCPRTHVSNLSFARPDLLDAHDLAHGHPVPLHKQNAFRYIVSTDGWSISSKFDKYLLMGSTILRAESTRFGFYYDAIKPYVQFVPFMLKHSDDLIEAVEWLQAHDAEARRIAEEARRFALHHLSRQARLCYLFRLITELSKRVRYKPDCKRRQMCVPLVQEVKFLASHGRSAKACRYSDVLIKYGDVDPDGQGAAAEKWSMEELRRLHASGRAWPRDDRFVKELGRLSRRR
ncbi:hypothetical protein HYH03_005081 [Edaphochlamys debaryana]|uniref:Glycosyl transferase CAP10 domain-containing protein n=1 Tax=Edaphochlamys debaryana TaxID=47281 RepID=A0A835Y673_9CHLO|nr:hypothetical protein HYH03_005081 [Edaphochlamys debaryana]|eukprot:KAG2497087.1 hypothetical protein HYH03_005081 [Edaphochlamys debaryana]